MKVELFKVVSIGKLKASELPDRSKVFAKLALEGQINSALRFLSETTSGGVRSLTDEVLSQLKQKHPLRGGSRGRVQGVSTPPPRDDLRFSNTSGILQKKCGLLVLK